MPPRSLSSDDTQLNRGIRRGLAAAAGLGLLASAPATVAAPGSGGAAYTPPPKVAKVACVTNCASKGRIQAGAAVRITGRNLASVTKVVFAGGSTKSDDEAVVPRQKSERSLTVPVPVDANSGPVVAMAGGVKSAPTGPVRILPAPAPVASADLAPATGPRQPGAPALETSTSTARFFVGSQRPVLFAYRAADGAASVDVTLVRAADGAVVRSWAPGAAQPGETRTISWNGLVDDKPQPDGRYAFRIVARNPSGATATNAVDGDFARDAFDLRSNVFPIRARHQYGQEGARYGAGRGSRNHRGEDVLAACGSKLVAARGGKVVFSGYQSAAGNYLVIRGTGSGFDYAYMHLAQPSAFRAGDRVFTGQQIGEVGRTGNATACLLHFELWTAPGWYEGGEAVDPRPYLEGWDRYS